MFQGTQTGPLYHPRRIRWGGKRQQGSKGRRHAYTYGWFMLRFDRKATKFCKEIMLQWKNKLKKNKRSHLSVQGIQLGSLVWEDSICCGGTKPMLLTPEHSTIAWDLWLLKPTCPGAHALQWKKPAKWETNAFQLESSPCLPEQEKGCTQQRRPSIASPPPSKST